MKCLVLFFTGLIFLVSCSDKQLPQDVIPRDAMVSLLVDVQLAESYVFSFLQDSIQLRQKNNNIQGQGVVFGAKDTKKVTDSVDQKIVRLRQQLNDFYTSVYTKHHINKSQFETSLKYYSKDPKLMDEMYVEVSESLKEKMKEFKSKE